MEVKDQDVTHGPEGYHYAAFISYRLVQPDRAIGEMLQRALETFRTPRSLVRVGIARRLGRVFRDTSELAASPDLNADLVAALHKSRFLIVVCSKRTPESRWIAREIEVFQEIGGGDRILALLIDGEPDQAYPTQFAHGSAGFKPLAADIRAPTLRKSLHELRRREKLRLIAPMLGVGFDDLWRRERRRRLQRMVSVAVLASVLIITITTLGLFSNKQSQLRKLTTTVAALTDHSLQLASQGRTGHAAELAMRAYGIDPTGKLGMQSRVYAALQGSLGSRHFNQIIAERPVLPHSVAVSADGRILAIGRRDGLEIFNLSKRATRLSGTRFNSINVTALAFLPPGQRPEADASIIRFAVGRDDGEVWIAAIDGAEIHLTKLGYCGTVETLAASPLGRIIAAGTEGEGVCLLDSESPGVISNRPVPGVVRALSFSPDGRWLAAGRRGGVELWAAESLNISAEAATIPIEGETVTSLALHGQLLATGSSRSIGRVLSEALRNEISAVDLPKGYLRIWNLAQIGHGAAPLVADPKRILSLTFSPNGHLLASGGVGGKIRLWAIPDPTDAARELIAHKGDVISMTFANNNELVSAGSDGTVRIWPLRGIPDVAIPTAGAVLSLAFIGSDRLAAAVKFEQAPSLWDFGGPTPTKISTAYVDGTVVSVAGDMANNGRFAFGTGIVLGGPRPDMSTRLWNLSESHFPSTPVTRHVSDVTALDIDPTGRWLTAAGSIDRFLVLADNESGITQEFALPKKLGKIYAIDVDTQSGPPLVAIGGTGAIALVDTSTGQTNLVSHVFGTLRRQWAVTDVAFSPDGSKLATTAPDGKVRVWLNGDWTQPATVLEPAWTAGPVAIRRLAFNRVSGELAVGYLDGAIRVWAPRRGSAPLLVRSADGKSVQSLAYDREGNLLAVGFGGGNLEVRSTFQHLIEIGCALRLNQSLHGDNLDPWGKELAEQPPCPDSPLEQFPGLVSTPQLDWTVFKRSDFHPEHVFIAVD